MSGNHLHDHLRQLVVQYRSKILNEIASSTVIDTKDTVSLMTKRCINLEKMFYGKHNKKYKTSKLESVQILIRKFAIPKTEMPDDEHIGNCSYLLTSGQEPNRGPVFHVQGATWDSRQPDNVKSEAEFMRWLDKIDYL